MTQYTNAKDINSRKRMDLALQMRIAGHSLAQISAACGWGSKASAHKAIKRAMAELPVEHAEELRDLQVARYDELLSAWWDRAKKDSYAAHLVLKIEDQRARLLGLNMEPTVEPVRVLIREIPQGYLREPEPASTNGAKPITQELTTT